LCLPRELLDHPKTIQEFLLRLEEKKKILTEDMQGKTWADLLDIETCAEDQMDYIVILTKTTMILEGRSCHLLAMLGIQGFPLDLIHVGDLIL
jgi:hypothetical protein